MATLGESDDELDQGEVGPNGTVHVECGSCGHVQEGEAAENVRCDGCGFVMNDDGESVDEEGDD